MWWLWWAMNDGHGARSTVSQTLLLPPPPGRCLNENVAHVRTYNFIITGIIVGEFYY